MKLVPFIFFDTLTARTQNLLMRSVNREIVASVEGERCQAIAKQTSVDSEEGKALK